MGFLGKIFKNKGIVTILSIALCLTILFFAYRYRVNTAINAVEIPVAVKRLEGRTQITESDIRYVTVASSMLSANVIRDKSRIVERYVNYNTVIPEGSMFYDNAVVDWKNMPDSAWKNIPEGNTVVSLELDAAYANALYPGDKIDLYFISTDSNKQIIGKLIEGLEILAVKDGEGNHIFNVTPDQSGISALIFSVPEAYHLLIKRAIKTGSLVPIPRNSSYNKEINVTSSFIIDFISKQYTTKTMGDAKITSGSGNNISVTE